MVTNEIKMLDKVNFSSNACHLEGSECSQEHEQDGGCLSRIFAAEDLVAYARSYTVVAS